MKQFSYLKLSLIFVSINPFTLNLLPNRTVSEYLDMNVAAFI